LFGSLLTKTIFVGGAMRSAMSLAVIVAAGADGSTTAAIGQPMQHVLSQTLPLLSSEDGATAPGSL
jgi:hypothetical protein